MMKILAALLIGLSVVSAKFDDYERIKSVLTDDQPEVKT